MPNATLRSARQHTLKNRRINRDSERLHPGRVIFYVSDVDALYERAIVLGLDPNHAPHDAAWGERYFHLTDPDGHEVSFARLLES